MYKVGQILYLILNKRQQVVPAQVVEQVVRRTLEGEMTLHSVKIPTKDSLYNLEELEAEIYLSLEEVQEKLRANALVVIDQMMAKTRRLAEKTFEMDNVPRASGNEEISQKATVTLEDGTIANVTLPALPFPE